MASKALLMSCNQECAMCRALGVNAILYTLCEVGEECGGGVMGPVTVLCG